MRIKNWPRALGAKSYRLFRPSSQAQLSRCTVRIIGLCTIPYGTHLTIQIDLLWTAEKRGGGAGCLAAVLANGTHGMIMTQLVVKLLFPPAMQNLLHVYDCFALPLNHTAPQFTPMLNYLVPSCFTARPVLYSPNLSLEGVGPPSHAILVGKARSVRLGGSGHSDGGIFPDQFKTVIVSLDCLVVSYLMPRWPPSSQPIIVLVGVNCILFNFL